MNLTLLQIIENKQTWGGSDTTLGKLLFEMQS